MTTVVLIGGPPGGGKTTTARAVAHRLGWDHLTLDDVATAAKALVPPSENADLHAMRHTSSIEYFTVTEPAALLDHAERAHGALWPSVEALIRHRAAFGPPIVIDGYHLLPERLDSIDLENVLAVFLDVNHAVLEARERSLSWYDQSDDPEAMVTNFLGRSKGWNDRISSAAREHGFTVVKQDGTRSVEQIVDAILDLMA